MSDGLIAELRTAFEEASDPLTPRADLADRVHAATRRRIRLMLASAVLVAVLAVGAGFAAAALVPGRHAQQGPRKESYLGRWPKPKLAVPMPEGNGVAAMAVTSRYLYVATYAAGNPPYFLTAYSAVTGNLIRRVHVPSMPVALRTGPGGLVWLTFSPDQNGGPSGTWLLNPDLSRRSAFRGGPADVLPTGRLTALLAWQHALKQLRMPFPGTAGQGSAQADHAYGITSNLAVASLAPVGGKVAARVTNGYGDHGHVVIAGQPQLSFGGGGDRVISFMVAEDDGLWVTTSAGHEPWTGPLVRLSPSLKVSTPMGARNTILGRSEQVWSSGDTVWVATANPWHQLVCFAYRNGRMGTMATLRPVRSEPVALAATHDTVYVTTVGGDVGVTSDVLGYPVPAACR